MKEVYIQRKLPLATKLKSKSVLLLGPRRTGKSRFVETQLKPDLTFNLLKAATFRDLSERPSLVAESISDKIKTIFIDEIQLLPELMNEVHALIEERKDLRFILTGSSARKLKRARTSLMAGRAAIQPFLPFTYSELKPEFNLNRAIQYGLLPPLYLNPEWDELKDYVGTYLKEEIQAEAFARNIEGFSRFLTVAGLSNSELIVFESIASDAQVPSRTIHEYFSILSETHLGEMLEPLDNKKLGRKSIAKSKFYFFDTGVVNGILGRSQISPKSPEWGFLFETFIFNQLRARRDYFSKDSSFNFWRSAQGDEVDFIINKEIGVEVKATTLVTEKHLIGLLRLNELYPLKRQIVVSQDTRRRRVNGVEIYPWREFLDALNEGEFF
jgi:predicted AAA+ superfamily ATPase